MITSGHVYLEVAVKVTYLWQEEYNISSRGDKKYYKGLTNKVVKLDYLWCYYDEFKNFICHVHMCLLITQTCTS